MNTYRVVREYRTGLREWANQVIVNGVLQGALSASYDNRESAQAGADALAAWDAVEASRRHPSQDES